MRVRLSLSVLFTSLALVGCNETSTGVESQTQLLSGAANQVGLGPIDADGDGALSEAEFVAGAAHLLEERDQDGDGVLQKSELGGPGKKPGCKADTNQDGVVTAEEDAAAANAKFAALDADGDGVLLLADLPPPPPGAQPNAIDGDGDGQVTKAEFLDAAADRFADRDANEDGVLTGDELLPPPPPDGAKPPPDGMQPPPDGAQPPPDGMQPPPDGMQPMQPKHPPFEVLDQNADGVVDLTELEASAKARFAELDADGNGLLEGDELPPPPPAQ